jgi:hypothetical protein
MRDSATPPSSPLLKDAVWYAAAAGAVVALAPTAADAQIVYTDIEPDLFVEDTDTAGDGAFTGLSADFDGDGDHEVLFFERDTDAYTRFAYDVDPTDGPDKITGAIGTLVPFGGGGTYLYPLPLSAGASIGPGHPDLVTATTYTYGTFTFQGSDPAGWLGTDAYLGVQFTLDGTSTHYGWIRVEIPNAGGAIIVKEMAYEATPDTPIEAGATGVAIEPGPDGQPGTHALSAAFPNPAADRAQVTLEVARTQVVRVVVYDARGREIATLHDGPLAAGRDHVLTFDGTRFRSGVYVVRVVGEAFSDARTVALVR